MKVRDVGGVAFGNYGSPTEIILTESVPAGNGIVVIVYGRDDFQSDFSFSDTQSNSYQSDVDQASLTVNRDLMIGSGYAAKGLVAGVDGINISFTFDPFGQFGARVYRVTEFASSSWRDSVVSGEFVADLSADTPTINPASQGVAIAAFTNDITINWTPNGTIIGEPANVFAKIADGLTQYLVVMWKDIFTTASGVASTTFTGIAANSVGPMALVVYKRGTHSAELGFQVAPARPKRNAPGLAR